MKISIKLLDTIPAIDDKIKAAVSEDVNQRLRVAKQTIVRETSGKIYGWIQSQPEMKSIMQDGPGSLSSQFGLSGADGVNAVYAIGLAVAKATTVEIRYYNKYLKNGGLWLNFQPASFKNLLNLQEGINTAYPEGHWLRHLLLSGNKTIVVGYQYTPGKGGRAGGGTMRPGGAWRVPPQFAGEEGNNFITRAFSGREKEVADIFSKALKF